MENFNQRLKRLRKAAKLTQPQLAKRAGVSQTTISDIERGRNENTEKIVELAIALGVTARYLKTGADTGSPTFEGHSNISTEFDERVKVPVISWGWVHKMSFTADTLEPKAIIDWLKVEKRNIGKRCFALRVSGDSMFSPDGAHSFEDGDTIVCDPDATPEPGDFVIAKDGESDAATFKRFVFDGGRYYLKPLNKAYMAIEIKHPEQSIIARVMRQIKTKEL